MIVLTIIGVICLVVLLYIAIIATIGFNKLFQTEQITDDIFYNSIKLYFGIRLLCKLGYKIDLDKFCEEYSNKFQNITDTEED